MGALDKAGRVLDAQASLRLRIPPRRAQPDRADLREGPDAAVSVDHATE